MNKRATIGDVARIAGVSTATVSRAIHTPGIVTESTRKAVQDAIAETGFTLNIAARTLRQQRANAVLVLVPDIGNTFFSEILAGIEKVASAAGQTILIGDTAGEDRRELAFLDYLINGRSDGALLLNGRLPQAVAERIAARRGGLAPIVSVSEALDPQVVPHVGIDNRAAADLATTYLVERGHRVLCHLAGPEGNILTDQRKSGFNDALDRAGVPAFHLIQGDFTIQSGMAAAEVLLSLDPRPTAVFSANDEMAIGLIAALAMRGVRVPEDVSVIGFDDISFAQATIPPLTTIRQPRLEIGETAMRTLMGLIGAVEAPDGPDLLEVELMERGSVAAI
ncbi:LacI family DNA-binding transcriptional regulator [Aestuariibius sp. 2305UL40-4]|uniref:LacI family DNA-binding transcriptional regulator n=1 Tax=Aestuariibius violaceus TaxID=3234132 RepID=UPI00345E3FC1